MKALSTLKSAIDQSSFIGIIALVSLIPVFLPNLALAAELQTPEPQALIFKIKVTDPKLLIQNENSQLNTQSPQKSLSIQTVVENDPLVIELKKFLADNGSPLDIYASEIVQQPQWQRALAISYVESHMGRDCFDNNCSGIGVKPGEPYWRKYTTKLDWFVDLNNLLEKPIYKDKYNTFQKMKGVYVQPGSMAWVNGAQQKFDQLMALTSRAEQERQRQVAESPAQVTTVVASVTTFPQLAELTTN